MVDAGHRVIATDASPAFLEMAAETVPDAEELYRLALPDDELPVADAVVSVGGVLNYLPDQAAVQTVLVAIAGALRSGGVMAIDLCDLRWGAARRDSQPVGRVADDWAVVAASAVPAPDRLVREITTFVRNPDGTWRRDDERHDNVLVDAAEVPELLAEHGIQVRTLFGDESLPEGMVAVVGHRPA